MTSLNPDFVMLASGAGLLLVAAVCAILGWRGESRLIAITETGTSSAAEVAEQHRRATVGQARFGEPVELCGMIECDSPLRAPLSRTPCVAYSYSVSQEVEKEQHYGYGPLRHEVEHEAHFHDGATQRAAGFWVCDPSGRVYVELAGAELDLKETDRRFESYTNHNGTSEREVWSEERSLPVGHQVYVLGYLGTKDGQPVVMRHPLDKAKRFLVSYRDEQELLGHTRWRSYGLYLAAGLSGGTSLVLALLALR